MHSNLTFGTYRGYGYGNDAGDGYGHGNSNGHGYSNGYGYGYGDGNGYSNGLVGVKEHIHPRVSASNDVSEAIRTAALQPLLHIG